MSKVGEKKCCTAKTVHEQESVTVCSSFYRVAGLLRLN